MAVLPSFLRVHSAYGPCSRGGSAWQRQLGLTAARQPVGEGAGQGEAAPGEPGGDLGRRGRALACWAGFRATRCHRRSRDPLSRECIQWNVAARRPDAGAGDRDRRVYRAVAAVVGIAAGSGVRPRRDRQPWPRRGRSGRRTCCGRRASLPTARSRSAWTPCRRWCCTRRSPNGSPGARPACPAWRAARCARTCGSSAAGSSRSCTRRTCRCPGNGPSSRTARRRSAGTWRWRTPSPPRAADAAAGLVCLGAGAGLIRGDLRDVRGTDVACRSGGVVVTVRGARPRAVPCWPATTPRCWPRRRPPAAA